MWPSNNPDFNPCDYNICSNSGQRILPGGKFQDVEDLAEHLIIAEELNDVTDKFRSRLRKMIEQYGKKINT